MNSEHHHELELVLFHPHSLLDGWGKKRPWHVKGEKIIVLEGIRFYQHVNTFIKFDCEENKAGLKHRPLPPGPGGCGFSAGSAVSVHVEQEVTVWRSWSQHLTSLLSCHLWLVALLYGSKYLNESNYCNKKGTQGPRGGSNEQNAALINMDSNSHGT